MASLISGSTIPIRPKNFSDPPNSKNSAFNTLESLNIDTTNVTIADLGDVELEFTTPTEGFADQSFSSTQKQTKSEDTKRLKKQKKSVNKALNSLYSNIDPLEIELLNKASKNHSHLIVDAIRDLVNTISDENFFQDVTKSSRSLLHGVKDFRNYDLETKVKYLATTMVTLDWHTKMINLLNKKAISPSLAKIFTAIEDFLEKEIELIVKDLLECEREYVLKKNGDTTNVLPFLKDRFMNEIFPAVEDELFKDHSTLTDEKSKSPEIISSLKPAMLKKVYSLIKFEGIEFSDSVKALFGITTNSPKEIGSNHTRIIELLSRGGSKDLTFRTYSTFDMGGITYTIKEAKSGSVERLFYGEAASTNGERLLFPLWHHNTGAHANMSTNEYENTIKSILTSLKEANIISKFKKE